MLVVLGPLVVGVLGACGDVAEVEDTALVDSPYTWQLGCADACSGYAGPFYSVPICPSSLRSGDGCAGHGLLCDPIHPCNGILVCVEEDPSEVGCPPR